MMEMIGHGFTEREILNDFSWLTISRYCTYVHEMNSVRAAHRGHKGGGQPVGFYRKGRITVPTKKAF